MIIIMNFPDPERPERPERASETGAALRARAQGARTAELGAALKDLDPDLLTWADEFIFGGVWSTDGISFDERMMVAIVALATSGQHAQLRNYLHGALQAGIDPVRIHESLKMLVVYIGFPAALAALVTYREVRAKYEGASG
jgi:4-carboxymuconolactone decarboxylase